MTDMMAEGWGVARPTRWGAELRFAQHFHYFVEGSSLCRKWRPAGGARMSPPSDTELRLMDPCKLCRQRYYERNKS